MVFIIYTSFEVPCSDPSSTSLICGSLQLDTAITEEEAVQKTAMYKQRADEFNERFPSPGTRKYGYYDWPHLCPNYIRGVSATPLIEPRPVQLS